MPAKVGNRIKQTTSTVGLGAYDLDAAVDTGWQAFKDANTISDGDQVFYVVWDGAGNYEISTGTLGVGLGAGGLDRITRDTIHESSEVGDAAVNWGSGTRDIWNSQPAGVFTLAANNGSDFNSIPTTRVNLDVGGLGENNTWTGNQTMSGKTTLSGTAVAPVGTDRWAT